MTVSALPSRPRGNLNLNLKAHVSPIYIFTINLCLIFETIPVPKSNVNVMDTKPGRGTGRLVWAGSLETLGPRSDGRMPAGPGHACREMEGIGLCDSICVFSLL